MSMYGLTVFDPSELTTLRDLLQRHGELAAAYAEEQTTTMANRLHTRLKNLEASITAEVHYLFDQEES